MQRNLQSITIKGLIAEPTPLNYLEHPYSEQRIHVLRHSSSFLKNHEIIGVNPLISQLTLVAFKYSNTSNPTLVYTPSTEVDQQIIAEGCTTIIYFLVFYNICGFFVVCLLACTWSWTEYLQATTSSESPCSLNLFRYTMQPLKCMSIHQFKHLINKGN